MGATTTDELVEAVCALHTRLARECERAAGAPRTQVLGGWAQLGAALDRLTQAAFVAACAERSLAPDHELRRVTGREAYEVSRAGSGQLARALAALSREAAPRDATLALIAAEAADKGSPLRRVIDQRNDMLHGRPHAGGDAAPSLLGSVTRWRLPYAATAAMPKVSAGEAPRAAAGMLLGASPTPAATAPPSTAVLLAAPRAPFEMAPATIAEPPVAQSSTAPDRRVTAPPVAVRAPPSGGVSTLRGVLVSVVVFCAALGGGAAWMRRADEDSRRQSSDGGGAAAAVVRDLPDGATEPGAHRSSPAGRGADPSSAPRQTKARAVSATRLRSRRAADPSSAAGASCCEQPGN